MFMKHLKYLLKKKMNENIYHELKRFVPVRDTRGSSLSERI